MKYWPCELYCKILTTKSMPKLFEHSPNIIISEVYFHQVVISQLNTSPIEYTWIFLSMIYSSIWLSVNRKPTIFQLNISFTKQNIQLIHFIINFFVTEVIWYLSGEYNVPVCADHWSRKKWGILIFGKKMGLSDRDSVMRL